MNKMELINTLRFEAEITKSEAAAVVELFFTRLWPFLSGLELAKI